MTDHLEAGFMPSGGGLISRRVDKIAHRVKSRPALTPRVAAFQRPGDHCAFGFAGGAAVVLALPFFFFVFFFGAVSAGAA